MPYKSAAQRAYMHVHHPGIANRWDKEHGGKLVATKNAPTKAGEASFSGAVLQRALARRGAPRSKGAPVKRTIGAGAPVGAIKNMPSGRAIGSPRAPKAGGTRSIPRTPGSNIKPVKAMQGGNQLQAVARRAMMRRRGGRAPRPGVARAYR